MAAGDITVSAGMNVGDTAAIDTWLTGKVVVADKIVAYTAGNQVFFAIVKAA